MRVIFHGPEHDFDAEAFADSLNTPGVGVLDHPVWGRRDVVPFGDWTERNDLKTAANQTIFDVTFYETIGLTFPESDVFASNAILISLAEYNDAAAIEFEERISTNRAVVEVRLAAQHDRLRAETYLALRQIAAAQDDTRVQFDTINLSLTQGIQDLVSTPRALAKQTALFVQSPARAVAAPIGLRVAAYGGAVTALVGGASPATENELRLRVLFTQLHVSGYALSLVNAQFETKPQAVAAADGLLALWDAAVAWQDTEFRALGNIDTGSAYQQLQEVVALTAGFLVQLSFSLKQERTITLDRARTALDVCAEYLGAVDDATLDRFIESNDLSGSAILELPKGREIVYYR
jgi:hypothetical protein